MTQSRRQFMTTTAAAAGALAVAGNQAFAADGVEIKHATKPRRLLKTLKIGMVKAEGGMAGRFKVAKAAGFDGIELDSPGFEVDEVKKAIADTGLTVDGSVCSTHWQIRHSSSDAAQRAKALTDLQKALRDTHAVGGHTVLLVVGHGDDGPETEIWQRSVENIRLALPLCAQLGMTIAIENVWNKFLYQHDGPNDQTAEKFVKYVDEFNSPWVGMQFDIGNHWKYGDPAAWIRQLGKRVVKLDIKGFSRQKNNWADITEDDLPWADVRKALDEIGFDGWVAAEVGGGDQARLTKIAQQIDKALNIG
ncbi:MAG: sugar phosphate isomerase/epimerase family protein [Pirellulales bacterium]